MRRDRGRSTAAQARCTARPRAWGADEHTLEIRAIEIIGIDVEEAPMLPLLPDQIHGLAADGLWNAVLDADRTQLPVCEAGLSTEL